MAKKRINLEAANVTAACLRDSMAKTENLEVIFLEQMGWSRDRYRGLWIHPRGAGYTQDTALEMSRAELSEKNSPGREDL